MKTPIEVKDIKAGDKLRWEGSSRGPGTLTAVEYKAGSDEHGQFTDGQHYLLDRPSPPVELPTEPTLGWIDSRHEGRTGKEKRAFGMFAAGENDCEFEQPAADEFGASGRKVNQHYRVTAFRPAVAVPKAALDKLRHRHEIAALSNAEVNRFLAAVDEANR